MRRGSKPWKSTPWNGHGTYEYVANKKGWPPATRAGKESAPAAAPKKVGLFHSPMERSALALQTIEDAAIICSLQRIGHEQNLRILRLMTNDEQIGDFSRLFPRHGSTCP